MLEVNSAEHIGGYHLNLSFNNGKTGTADLEQTIFTDNRPIFEKLRDKSNFTNFKVEHSTVVWFDELDLAAEYLYFLAFKEDQSLQEQFKAWGYVG